MSKKLQLSYLFRKHSLVRLLTLVIFAALFFIISTFFTQNNHKLPVIQSINPPVGTPGDILVIDGNNFGNTQDTSYVEISNNRLTASNYISWNDSQIKAIIPGGTQDGLVYVVSKKGRSNPDFFTNKTAIPVAMPQDPMLSTPIITALSKPTVYPGELLTITGKNFGLNRENANVYFSSKQENQTSSLLSLPSELRQDNSVYGSIPASQEDFDYEYWSESEIRLRVPDGASSGSVFVMTEKGKSPSQPITVRTFSGTKSFDTKHTYLIQVSADVANIYGSKNSLLTLRVPNPIITASQPMASLTEANPKPFIENYHNTSIFQIEAGKEKIEKKRISESFVISVYTINTDINIDNIKPFSEKSRMLYKTYTKADECVNANADEIKELLPSIIFQVKNPYRQAKLIFDYMIKNYKIQEKVRTGDVSPLDMLKTKRGDAYDFAMLYVAFLRTAGIPSRPISGILIDADKQTKNHWWCEFYVESFGWIPCDLAIASGLEYKPFLQAQNQPSFYFGNLDSQHIAFSRNWNSTKQSLANSRIVYIPRTYALQSIWEEAEADITSYSSLWNQPVVLGIY